MSGLDRSRRSRLGGMGHPAGAGAWPTGAHSPVRRDATRVGASHCPACLSQGSAAFGCAAGPRPALPRLTSPSHGDSRRLPLPPAIELTPATSATPPLAWQVPETTHIPRTGHGRPHSRPGQIPDVRPTPPKQSATCSDITVSSKRSWRAAAARADSTTPHRARSTPQPTGVPALNPVSDAVAALPLPHVRSDSAHFLPHTGSSRVLLTCAVAGR